MRRQDELIALYPGRDSITRQFILSQLEGLALAFDSEELLDFLRTETQSEDRNVQRQALYTQSRFLPGYTQKRFCLSRAHVGTWTRHGAKRSELNPLLPLKDLHQRRSDRHRTCLALCEGVARQTLKRMDHPHPQVRRVARQVLAQFPIPCVREYINDKVQEGFPDFEELLLYVAVHSTSECGQSLPGILYEHGPQSPELLHFLSECPAEPAFAILMDLIDKCDLSGRIRLAASLGQMAGVNHREAIRRLLSRQEGWVQVYCLRSIEQLGEPSYLDMVRDIHSNTKVEFVRAQAIRAAGGLSGDASIDFCMRALESPSSRLTAQALESLVRLECPPERLDEIATPLGKSSSPRTRINALLATANARSAALPAPLRELLISTEELSRLEAAWGLGYLQSKSALACLATLVRLEPAVSVRIQAMKALSRYDAHQAVTVLLPLFKEAEPQLGRTAARVLTRYEGTEGELVAKAVLGQLPAASTSQEKMLLLSTLGTLAGKHQLPSALPPLEAALAGNDTGVATAAIEGLIVARGERSAAGLDQLRILMRYGSSAQRPRATLALFMSGAMDAPGELAELLCTTDINELLQTLEIALDLGLAVPQLVDGDQFPLITSKLDEMAAGDTTTPVDITLDVEQTMASRILRRQEVREMKTRPEGEFLVHSIDKQKRPSRKVRREEQPWSAAELPAVQDAPAPPPAPQPAAAPPAAPPENPPVAAGPPSRASGVGPALQPKASARLRAPPSRVRASQAHIVSPTDPSTGYSAIEVLEKHLLSTSARGIPAKLGQQLGESTYLIGQKLVATSFFQTVKGNRSLAVAGGAMVLMVTTVIGGFLLQAQANLPRDIAPFSATKVNGSVKIRPPVRTLERGQQITAGVSVSTESTGRAVLSTRRGNWLKLEPDAQITVKRLGPGDGEMELDATRGQYYFEFTHSARGEVLKVHYDRYQVETDRAGFSIEKSGNHYGVIVDVGQVTITAPDGTTGSVNPGEFGLLEPGN